MPTYSKWIPTTPRRRSQRTYRPAGDIAQYLRPRKSAAYPHSAHHPSWQPGIRVSKCAASSRWDACSFIAYCPSSDRTIDPVTTRSNRSGRATTPGRIRIRRGYLWPPSRSLDQAIRVSASRSGPGPLRVRGPRPHRYPCLGRHRRTRSPRPGRCPDGLPVSLQPRADKLTGRLGPGCCEARRRYPRVTGGGCCRCRGPPGGRTAVVVGGPGRCSGQDTRGASASNTACTVPGPTPASGCPVSSE